MTTLYLVRHGETIDNAAQVMQGQTQGRLNANGIRQAELLREQLCREPIDAFVASDLNRAIETCRIIALPHRLPIETTPLLRERDWGNFTGRYIPDLRNVPLPPNVESIERIKARALAFLSYIKTAYPDQTVLAVGHGIINKAIQSVFFRLPMNEVKRMENAEVRILQL